MSIQLTMNITGGIVVEVNGQRNSLENSKKMEDVNQNHSFARSETDIKHNMGRWEIYDTTTGMVGGTVNAMVQDKNTYLWFGTYDGVSRFDGQTWTTFTTEHGLVDNKIESIALDRQGWVWFGTQGGVSRYDGQTWITFTTRDGLVDNWVTSIFLDCEGLLWFGTQGGVSRYDGQTWTAFTAKDGLVSDKVERVFQDRNGHLWFGTRNGMSRYDGHIWTTFTTKDGLTHNWVRSIIQDRKGHLWVGARAGGVSRYDGHNWTTYTTRDGLGYDKTESIFQDREGCLWFGTRAGGVSRYDGHNWTTYTTREGLAHNRVRSIMQDREGCLWFGTPGGVNRYDEKTFVNFVESDGLSHNTVYAVFQDRDGQMWFGTHEGASRYDGQKWITYTLQDGLAHNRVRSITQGYDGHLWFATPGGVSRYDGQNWTTYTTENGLKHDMVFSVFRDRNGKIWCGTHGGASCYDGNTWTTYTTREGLADNAVFSVFQGNDGYLWFATYRGISRYDGVSWHTTNSLENNATFSVFQDRDGHLWCSHGAWGHGVSQFDGHNWTTYTTRDGLSDNNVRMISQDRDGHLWFGTSGGGAGRYDGRVFQFLTRQNGLAGNVVNTIFQDRNGCFWFGTNNGVTRFEPPLASFSPSVHIDAVVADARYENMDDLSLSSSVGLVVFEFHGVSFKTRAGALVYRYRLKGRDDDWKTTRLPQVQYQNLHIGTYVFEVIAVDRDLVYSDQPATARLKVLPDPRLVELTEALSRSGDAAEMVGGSSVFQDVKAQLARVAPTDLTVLLCGETGVGKGLFALALHRMSLRKGGPFIHVSCGAIPEGLVESELFGHERGAFTSATNRKLGKFELASGGTIFLDEIGDMPLASQAKLLRLLEEGTFERVGGTETLMSDVRVVAATNRKLEQMVADGRFREDLFCRLQVFPIHLPPLRYRLVDIPMLAVHFMREMAHELKKDVVRIEPEAVRALQNYDWPGNVRELRHMIHRAVIVCPGNTIRQEDILLGAEKTEMPASRRWLTPEDYERDYLLEALEKCNWVIKGPNGAAVALNIPPATLRYRMKKLGIRKEMG